jgi:hypothetical protein
MWLVSEMGTDCVLNEVRTDTEDSNDLNILLYTALVQEMWYLAFYEISTGNLAALRSKEKYKKCHISCWKR